MTAASIAVAKQLGLSRHHRRRATDLIFVLMSPENYRACVLGAGWPQREWVRWVSDTLCRDLFGNPPPTWRKQRVGQETATRQ